MRKIFLALIIAVCTLSANAQQPIPGTDMPKALFYKTDGGNFSTDLIPKGTKSMIILFDATCDHCQKVATNISKRSDELTNVNIYLVTQDEIRSVNYFMDNFAKPLKTMKNVTVLQDRDRIFIPLFHPKQYPSLYLYGKDKKLEFYSSDERDVPRFFSRIK
ncbi:hypothetical protein ABDJ41_16600 [Pedobacter sp. ASV1-7]|uniref:hypothetical protein n=1 Tax=Pedobacter sp. ASV1-7 TaxID=3145237 RepID=UPI0032E918FD